MFETYFPLALQFIVAAVIGGAMFVVSALLGKRTRGTVKEDAYECGIEPVGDTRHRFSVKYYMVAILFLVFDLETAFLFPWAVCYNKLALFGLIEMLIFILILLVGYIYIVKKGVFNWD